MKAALAFSAVLLILQQTDGCGDTKPQPEPKPAPPPINRFVPVANHGSADVALDTTTGQLCRTWEWEYKSDSSPDKGGLDLLPTCLAIYMSPMPSQPK